MLREDSEEEEMAGDPWVYTMMPECMYLWYVCECHESIGGRFCSIYESKRSNGTMTKKKILDETQKSQTPIFCHCLCVTTLLALELVEASIYLFQTGKWNQSGIIASRSLAGGSD